MCKSDNARHIFCLWRRFQSKQEMLKASDTLDNFIRRSLRSAKIARCARCSDCDFRRSPGSAYKIADIWHVRYRGLNSPAFVVYCCESQPIKPTHQVWQFYLMSFYNCHIAAIGEKKSPGVSASIGGENRLRFSLAIKFAAIGV